MSAKHQRLLDDSGVDQHRVDADTTSIMSGGMDVMPAHYVTLWEALGQDDIWLRTAEGVEAVNRGTHILVLACLSACSGRTIPSPLVFEGYTFYDSLPAGHRADSLSHRQRSSGPSVVRCHTLRTRGGHRLVSRPLCELLALLEQDWTRSSAAICTWSTRCVRRVYPIPQPSPIGARVSMIARSRTAARVPGCRPSTHGGSHSGLPSARRHNPLVSRRPASDSNAGLCMIDTCVVDERRDLVTAARAALPALR